MTYQTQCFQEILTNQPKKTLNVSILNVSITFYSTYGPAQKTLVLSPELVYQLIYKPSYCNFLESRKKI